MLLPQEILMYPPVKGIRYVLLSITAFKKGTVFFPQNYNCLIWMYFIEHKEQAIFTFRILIFPQT